MLFGRGGAKSESRYEDERSEREEGALLIHRGAVPLLPQEKAKDADAVTVGNREGALRVVGAPTPTEENKNRRGYKYAFSGGRRWQPKADG